MRKGIEPNQASGFPYPPFHPERESATSEGVRARARSLLLSHSSAPLPFHTRAYYIPCIWSRIGIEFKECWSYRCRSQGWAVLNDSSRILLPPVLLLFSPTRPSLMVAHPRPHQLGANQPRQPNCSSEFQGSSDRVGRGRGPCFFELSLVVSS